MKAQINSMSNSISNYHMNNSTHLTHHNSTHSPQPQTKMDKLQQNNLKKIQQHVSTFYSLPQCNGFCQCQICKQKYQLKDKGRQFLRQTSSLIKLQTNRIKTFYKYMSSLNKKVSFRLQIPTLCFFQKGECKLMFKSKNQYIQMFQHSQVAKKNIANFFIEANRKRIDNQVNVNANQDNHIRHFSTVVPSYIHGVNQQDQQMKQTKTFFFHKDRFLEGDGTHIVEKSISQEVAIIKYLDNKGYELLNEKQLRQLLKTPVNTQCIDFIQAYIKPHQVESQFLFSQYHGFNPPENLLMWNRSNIQIKLEVNLINKYSKDYIPIEHLQNYEEVLKEIPDEYILYQTYKMVHFMELIRDIKITNLTTVWLKDEFKEIAFFGILTFDFQENQKPQVDYGEAYSIRQMIDKPYNDLQVELLGMWQKIKAKKLKQLTQRNKLKQEDGQNSNGPKNIRL